MIFIRCFLGKGCYETFISLLYFLSIDGLLRG